MRAAAAAASAYLRVEVQHALHEGCVLGCWPQPYCREPSEATVPGSIVVAHKKPAGLVA
jgi:hypothetical protein